MRTLAPFIFIFIVEILVVAILALVSGAAAIFGAQFKSFFVHSLWVMLLPLVLLLYGAFIERNIYEVKPVEITSGKLPASFDGYRVVQFSDAHLSSFQMRPRSLRRFVRKVNALEPDVILFTGDIVTVTPKELNDTLKGILAVLRARDGVYSIVGNHDYCLGFGRAASGREALNTPQLRSVIREEGEMGWHVLLDENVNLSRVAADGSSDTISIVGVRNYSPGGIFPLDGDIEQAMQGATGSYRILMSHDPTHWRAQITSRDDVDLMLSGHTHSMQLGFFGWSPCKYFYPEYRGLYERSAGHVKRDHAQKEAPADAQYLYVNIGMGETGVPARVGACPEITLFTLRSK